MNAAIVFAVVVGLFGCVLTQHALCVGRWLEAGIAAGATVVCALLADAVTRPAIPLGLLLLAVWAVVVLVGLAAWSLLRAREKQATGEETR